MSKRDKHVDHKLDLLKTNKTALVHSRIGNGKTIFTATFALKATAAGHKCFLWRRAGRRLAQDLDVISAQKRVLIIFDDYDAAIENIQRVSTGLPEAKFIVTVRTGQQEVRLHEIVQKLPAPVQRVNINAFEETDKKQLLAILDRAGARADGLVETIRSAREIRDIVTQLYNHSEIRQKIHDVLVAAPAPLTQIVILACLIKWVGVEMDDNYLQELAERDVYGELRRADSLTSDFLDVRDDRVEMRSSLLAEYFIHRIFSPKDILDGCYEITTLSTRRRSDRAHRRLSGELMKFSTLQRFLKFHADVDEALERHYIRLSNDNNVNAEPLFWLQYAIFMKKSGNIRNARLFLNTGYERAARLEGFKTFQLDTQALSIYLQEEINRRTEVVEGLEHILASIKTVSDMIADQSHRQYAIEVIGEVPAFIETRLAALKDPEKNALIFELHRAMQALATLPVEEKAHTGSETVRAQLDVAVARLAVPSNQR